MTEIRELTVKKTKRKKVNQLPLGGILLIAIIGAGYFLENNSPKTALMWLFGVILGFTLQKSRFCCTASLRDPILTGSTTLTKALIISIGVATLGFAAIQFSAVSKNLAIPGNISPAGLNTVIGALMFGIGMVIAGGCASGTFMRIGEGFLIQIVTLIFFVGGSLWGAHDFGWWSKYIMPNKGIFLPSIVGWGPAIAIQFGLLFAIYIFADWYGNRKSQS